MYNWTDSHSQVYANSLMTMWVNVDPSTATYVELLIRLNTRASMRTTVFGSTDSVLPAQEIPLNVIGANSGNPFPYSCVTQTIENQYLC